MEWSVSGKLQVLGEALESVGIGWPDVYSFYSIS
jgi:hypothetical protein